jgi:rubrerythrin
MSGVSEKSLQMLALALEKEQSGWSFYKDAAAKCRTEMGQEIFRRLMADEGVHIQRVKEIYGSLAGGGTWSEDWKTYRTESEDLTKLIQQRVTKLGSKVKAETGDLEAVEIGIGMEQGAIDFYDEQMNKATDRMEQDFISVMLAEERTHFAALQDLKLLLENPESWFVEKEHHVLDGA